MSSTTQTPFGWGGDVDTNVQWCSVVKTKLGNHRMVIGGEVDCVRGEHTRTPKLSSFSIGLAERFRGRTDDFVELKTSLAIRGPYDETKFER